MFVAADAPILSSSEESRPARLSALGVCLCLSLATRHLSRLFSITPFLFINIVERKV